MQELAILKVTESALDNKNMIIYGGAFDPITVVHEQIMRGVEAATLNATGLKYILAVTQDDEKNYSETYDNRVTLVENTVTRLGSRDDAKCKWTVVQQNCRMQEFINTYICDHFNYNHITLVLGEDEWDDLQAGKWVGSEWILNNCEFIVFARPEDTCSSTKIRKAMRFNPLYAFETMSDPESMLSEDTAWKIAYNHMYGQYTKREYDRMTMDFVTEYKQRIPKKIAECISLFDKGSISKDELVEALAKVDYPHPYATASVIIHNVNDDTYAIIKRNGHPFKGFWAFPGGFCEEQDDEIAVTAARECSEECYLDAFADNPSRYHQFYTYKAEDPRGWVHDTFFYTEVPNGIAKRMKAGDDAGELVWVKKEDMPKLAFHHSKAFELFLARGFDK